MVKGVKMSLKDFQSGPSASSWADDVQEDLPAAPAAAAIEYDYKTNENSTARQSARPASRDVPSHPPFVAFIGSLSFETRSEQIDQYFKDLDDLKIVRDADGRSKGFAYVTFNTQQALKDALAMDNGTLDGRQIRVDVGESSHSEGPRHSVSDNISDWRSKAPGATGGTAFGGVPRQESQQSGSFGAARTPYVSQNASYLATQHQIPTERKRIVPAARTAPPKIIQVVTEEVVVQVVIPQRQDSSATLIADDVKPKFNPFGAAKPRDEAEIARLSAERLVERTEKERVAKEEKRAEEMRVRAAALEAKANAPAVIADAAVTADVEKKLNVLTVADTQTNWRSRPASTTPAPTDAKKSDGPARYSAKRTSTTHAAPKEVEAKPDRMSMFGGKDKEARPVYLKKEHVKVAATNAFDLLGDN